MGDDALIWVENSTFGLYLRDIATYLAISKIDTIFCDDTCPEKITLQAENKYFWVNKTLLSERLDYFKAIFRSGMRESNEENIDLSLTFSADELAVLLFQVNSGDYLSLTIEQARVLVSAASKIAALEIVDNAQIKIDELRQLISKEFLLAIRARDYAKCTEMLKKGANINEKFGQYSQDLHDACSFCGPNDTPYSHAIKKEDIQLIQFLLKNGVDTKVLIGGETPLMVAAFEHNLPLVKLLLEQGNNPNDNDGFALCSIFLRMRDWRLQQQEKSASDMVKLFLINGFIGEPEKIIAILQARAAIQNKSSIYFQKFGKNKTH